MNNHRVVALQDASRELNTSAIPWAINKLKLIGGDSITLLGVLDQFETPMGYRSKVDSSSIFGANKKMIREAVTRKVVEFQSNPEIIELGTLCESSEIDFKIEVVAGPSRKQTALEAAASLEATWVILDRHMKKDNKYFLQKLSCGISQLRDDNTVELLRGRKSTKAPRPPQVPKQNGIINGEETAPMEPHRVAEDPSPSLLEPSTSSTAADIHNIEIGGGDIDEPKHIYPQMTVITAHKGPEQAETTGGEAEKAETGELDAENRGGEAESMGGDSECEICRNNRLRYGYECKRDFTYEELHDSTCGFSPENCMSNEEFGSAYKGQLKDGMTIVVKMKKNTILGKEEFEAKVNVLCRVSHKNVITLLGWCGEGHNRLLVYEYVCNGSLDQHLSEHTSRPPTWNQRLDIALRVAKGLHHLHENRIIHQDIRSDSILLTHNFEPLIGELGIMGEKYDSDKFSEDKLRYSDYWAPEYTETGKLSSKTDVYSFGVVLLELLTGQVVTEMALKGTSLVSWARPLLRDKKYLELVDPRLGTSYDVQQLIWMFQVTRNCLAKNPKLRITIDGVVSTLDFILSQRSVKKRDHAKRQSDVRTPEGGAEQN